MSYTMVWSLVYSDASFDGIAAMANDGAGHLLAFFGHNDVGSAALRSLDNGQTWLPTGVSLPNGAVDLTTGGLPKTLTPGGGAIFVHATSGVRSAISKTTDGGATWAEKYVRTAGAFPNRDRGASFTKLANGDYLAVGVWLDTIARYSAGTTYAIGNTVVFDAALGVYHKYTSLQNGNINHLPSTSPTFWTDNGLWTWMTLRSTDGGDTWALDIPLADPGVVAGTSGANQIIQLDDGSQTLLMAPGQIIGTPGTIGPRVYRSTNAGSTWAAVNMPARGGHSYYGNGLSIEGLYYVGAGVVLAVGGAVAEDGDQFGTQRLFIWRSVDYGASWAQVTSILRDPSPTGANWNPLAGAGFVKSGSVIAVGFGYANAAPGPGPGDSGGAGPPSRASDDGGATFQVAEDFVGSPTQSDGTYPDGWWDPPSAQVLADDGAVVYGFGWDNWVGSGVVEIWRAVPSPSSPVITPGAGALSLTGYAPGGAPVTLARVGATALLRLASGEPLVAVNTPEDPRQTAWWVSDDAGLTWRATTVDTPWSNAYGGPAATAQMALSDTGRAVAVTAYPPISPFAGEVWIAQPAACGDVPDPILLPPQGPTRYYAREDIDDFSTPYLGRLLGDPAVVKSLLDTLWGPVQIESITFRLALDPTLLLGQRSDLRGQWITAVRRYDRADGWSMTKGAYVVSRGALPEPGVLEVEAHNLTQQVLEQRLPLGLITTREFPRAVDIGQVITVVGGDVAQVPLRYINDDVIGSHFDYLVARGAVGVPNVFRLSPGGVPVDVDPSEYIVSSTLYPCYTVVRFILRQTDFSGAFIPIWADVVGPQDMRNVARTIRYFLTNAAWGLGRTVDEPSFQVAETLMEPSTSGLYCDFALTTQEQAQVWLAELCMFRGLRIGVSPAGAFTLTVDQAPSNTPLALADGLGDNPRNIAALSRDQVPDTDAVRDAILLYRQDMTASSLSFFFPQSRHVNRYIGANMVFTNRFVRDHATADRIIDFLGKRLAAAQEPTTIAVGQVGRAIQEGDLVDVSYTPYEISHATMQAVSVRDDSIQVTLLCYDDPASIFVYTPAPLPTESTGGGGKVGGPDPVPGSTPPPGGGPGPGGGGSIPPPVYCSAGTWGCDGRGPVIALDYRTKGVLVQPTPIGTIPANTTLTFKIDQRRLGANAIVPGSLRIWDDPLLQVTLTTHDAAGNPVSRTFFALTQPSSQRITDDGLGNLIGAIGTGPATVDYVTGVLTFSFAADAVSPIIGQFLYPGFVMTGV